jgi:hypothetical protein
MAVTRDPKIKVPRGRPLLWLVGVTALALGLVLGWYARDFFAVNACLDAGGAWAQPGVCVGAPMAAALPPVR